MYDSLLKENGPICKREPEFVLRCICTIFFLLSRKERNDVVHIIMAKEDMSLRHYRERALPVPSCCFLILCVRFPPQLPRPGRSFLILFLGFGGEP